MGSMAKNERANPSRVDDTRESELVHGDDYDKPWTPPHNLTAPEPRPGMAQRWIRTELGGTDDSANLARSMQEGWKLRSADSVPDNFPVPTISHGKHAGAIGVQGLVLCEMPKTRLAQREAYYAAQNKRQNDAVTADLLNEVGDSAIDERASKTTSGKIPKIADE